MSDPKQLIVILGPHRSGTSLYTAAMQALGGQLRLPAHYTTEENRKGFFEHPDIVDFNDSLLSHLGGSWDNPLFDGLDAIANTDLSGWRNTATGLFNSIYQDTPIAAIKDPRFCQLFTFWLQVFGDCGYRDENIFVVHVLRRPTEVAMSQQKRSKDNTAYYEIGAELSEGAVLWLALSAQALIQTRGLNGIFLSYVELLSTPQEALNKLAEFLKLTPDESRIRNFISDFVDTSLHRSIANPAITESLSSSVPQVLEFDAELQTLSSGELRSYDAIGRALEIYRRGDTQLAISKVLGPAVSRLSQRSRTDRLEVERLTDVVVDMEQQVSEHSSVVNPLRAHISQLEEGNVVYEKVTASLRKELETQRVKFEYAIGQMQASTSWKVTKPIRKLGAFRKRLILSIQKNTTRFRLRSIHKYQRMSVRHPRIAWISRVAVRPLFRIMKRFISDDVRFTSAGRADDPQNLMRYQSAQSSPEFQPYISIIVPNYNHVDYLPLRLDSIYSQTYQNFEVILLDDASTDGSSEILNRYLQEHPERTTLLENSENSGGVFYQWERGLKLAKGDIIWIAESDDWCSEDFLETLIPFFENEAIQLAYCRTVFMDASGEEPQWSINEYLHDIDPDRWSGTIVESANKIVADAFAIKNIIPNVSSAIFKNPGPLEILEDQQWKEMQICGDWVFYLHLLRGGVLAYSPDACNYYRIHGKNTSVKSYSGDTYYAEHEVVAKTVQRYYRVNREIFGRQRLNLIAHWRESRPSFSEEAFEKTYSLSRIDDAATERAPNLLMASYGFCSGGGETFPVELANLMKGSDYNITYLDCAQEPRNDGVRANLRIDIPVVSDFTHLEAIVSDFGIDLVHSHHAWVDSTILDLLPPDLDCKTIVTLHGMYETINSVDLRFILPRLVKRSARLIYVADKNLSALKAHKLTRKEQLVRIENALSPADFEPVQRSSLGISEKAFVVTLISRGMVEKGWKEAIQVVGQTRAISGNDIHLILVGDGAEYDRLLALNLPEYIHLEGFQRNVRGYFAIADVGILPSKFRGESSPLVIIECLQAGRPFLASSLGDISHMLSSPGGLAGSLIELDGLEIDIPLWAKTIDDLASDKQALELLQSRVAGAAKKFDAAAMIKKHDEVYRSVLGETGL